MRRTGTKPNDFLPLSATPYYVLSSLRAAPKHGYAIIKDIEAVTEGRVSLGVPSLYENISRLLSDGLIEPAGERPIGRGERRKTYRLSGLGQRVLAAEDSARSQVIARNRGRLVAQEGA